MDTRVAFMTQYSSLLRGLAAGSIFIPFCPNGIRGGTNR
ncbi:Uncharacterised protein [Shigella sonnei]|nr:Uncharacterised protein [Shigella sonnei]